MPNRRHSSRRFTPSCSNNITNSCRCDMIDCSDHGTPAPPPTGQQCRYNASTMSPNTRPLSLPSIHTAGEGGPSPKGLVGEGASSSVGRVAGQIFGDLGLPAVAVRQRFLLVVEEVLVRLGRELEIRPLDD